MLCSVCFNERVLVYAVVCKHVIKETVACADCTHQCLTGLFRSSVLNPHIAMLVAPCSFLEASSCERGLIEKDQMPTLCFNFQYLLVQLYNPVPVLLFVLAGYTWHICNLYFLLGQASLSHDPAHCRSTDAAFWKLTMEEHTALFKTKVCPCNLILLAADIVKLVRLDISKRHFQTSCF